MDSPVVTVGAAVGPLVAVVVVVVGVAGVVVAAGGLAVELQPASGNAAAASARAKVANREWVARSARNGFSTTSADPLQSVYHS